MPPPGTLGSLALAGLIVLIGALWWGVLQLRRHRDLQTRLEREQADSAEQRGRLALREQELRQAQERQAELREEREAIRAECHRLQEERAGLQARLAQRDQELHDERRSAAEKLALLEEAKQSLADRFRSLAGDILQANTRQFGQQQQERLDASLRPFREQIAAFQEQVRHAQERDGAARASLLEHIKLLNATGQRMSSEADALAKALSGQAKTRGDWGEMVLERLLQHAGLSAGREYRVQAVHQADDGARLQPDIVIDLPDDKHLVIDAKLNLIAWMRLCEAQEADAREAARHELLAGVRSHIRQLGGKRYQKLYGLATVDFVLMFIPIEGAFHEICSRDEALYREALDADIVLVSPTTLLATMRTIAAIWRYDRQERNAQAIAEQAGRMYDQLCRYLASFDAVGERLRQAQDSWELARRRLHSGRGNLVRRAEQLREMGAHTGKRLERSLCEAAAEDERDAPADGLEQGPGTTPQQQNASPAPDPSPPPS
ncbi:MAG: DNA recombination protein RmuC [Planctomycetota bacterium]